MGVASVKLEGRMKRPEYVATVTAVYRKALDTGVVTPNMMTLLLTAFNRDGFTDGYYTGRVDRKMFGIRQDEKEDTEWLQHARQSYETGEAPLVDIRFRMSVTTEGSELTVTDPQGNQCRAIGPLPELARNVPLTGEAVSQRLAKTGGTPFRCVEVRAHVEPGLTMPASAINGLRRDVLNQLTAIRARRHQAAPGTPRPIHHQKGPKEQPGLTVQITQAEQLTPRLLNFETAMLYVPIHLLTEDPALAKKLARRGHVAAVLPRIVHDGELPPLMEQLAGLRRLGIRDVLVGNLGLLAPVREAGMEIHGDFGLNVYSSAAMNFLKEMELASATLSFEMTLPQIRDVSKAVPAEVIAYGRLPLMITEHCLIHNRTGKCTCTQGTPVKLTDKTGSEFPIIKDGSTCRSVLLNGRKLYWLDRQSDLNKLGL